jgi:hypothetical protein
LAMSVDRKKFLSIRFRETTGIEFSKDYKLLINQIAVVDSRSENFSVC